MLLHLHRQSVLALALTACALLPLPIVESCGGSGGSPASTTGTGGAGGTTSSSFFVTGAGGSTPDACSGPDAGESDGGTGCDGIEGGVTYEQAGAILAGCTGEICHGPWTHDTVVGVPATQCCDGRFLVQPGNAAASYLIDKASGHDMCQGARMPFDLPPLPDAETLTLVQWICEGAPGP